MKKRKNKRTLRVQKRLRLIKKAIELFAEPKAEKATDEELLVWKSKALFYPRAYFFPYQYSLGFSGMEMHQWLRMLINYLLENNIVDPSLLDKDREITDFSKQLVIFYLKKLENAKYLYSLEDENPKTKVKHQIYFLRQPWSQINKTGFSYQKITGSKPNNWDEVIYKPKQIDVPRKAFVILLLLAKKARITVKELLEINFDEFKFWKYYYEEKLSYNYQNAQNAVSILIKLNLIEQDHIRRTPQEILDKYTRYRLSPLGKDCLIKCKLNFTIQK